jgi:hypothetical protein
MVQKALIDDEISEKKAGLLLYSLQIAASNVKQTTFIHEEDKEVVTEMPEEPAISTWPLAVSQTQNNIHHGDAEARRNTGSGDREIGGSSDREIGGSGDREKVALGVGQLVQDNIHHGDAEARRNTGSGDREICGSGDRVIG